MDRLSEYTKLMDALYNSSRVIHKYESKPRYYGTDEPLYMIEMHVLASVFRNEGITVTELAKQTQRTKSAVSQQINKLEKKGFIKKQRNENYHKEINLFTTEKGKEACQYHSELDRKNYSKTLELLNDYTIEEFQRFIRLNNIIIEEMSKDDL